MNLLIGPFAPIFNADSSNALAALEVVNDEQGANDEPGQKDLTQLGIDYAGLPNTVFVQFNLDDTAWSGNNSGDGCTLFDTDDDLNVNFSLCATVKGEPAAIVSTTLYACTADAKVDRCTGPSLLMAWDADDNGPCDAAILATDPFPTGDFHPNDAVVTCTIDLSLVGASTAELVNVCSYPSQEPNSDPSDCVLIIRDGALRVTKVVTNDNGGTLKCEAFSFTVQPGAISENFEADPDCSNLIAVEPGTYSVTEPAVAGYATSYSNCTNVAVASGEIETCTITNNDQGATLTVTKIVVNDNGGTAVVGDFPLFIDGNATTSGSAVSVNAGQHTVSETGDADYAATIGGDCAADGTVTIALGESKACTITNNDKAPGLTLVKAVTNDNGGTSAASAFTLTATGPTGFSGAGPSVSNGASFDAGTYNLSESGPDGYTGSAWVCVGGTQDDDTITLALGESATCTITNDDDEPGLTLVKSVRNDNGGTASADDWTLTATGPTGFSGAGPSVSNGASFDAGTYNLSESGPDGYTGSAWVCVGGTQDDDDTITLALGESATCTITNDDDEPSLTLIKEVINDDGGDAAATDWTLSATGTGGSPTNLSGDSPVSSSTGFKADTYALAESGGPSGYTAGSWDCGSATMPTATSVAVGLGDDVTCTIVNDDEAATLIVEKVIVGGDLNCVDFYFGLNDSPTPASFESDCSNQLTVDAGDYTVFEPNFDGYTTTYENSLNDNEDCDDLHLGNGETATCTITNTRDTGDLTVVKELIPSNDPGKFNLKIDDDIEAANVGDGGSTGAITLETGSFDVSETAGTGTTLTDYASSIECVDDGGEGDVVASASGAGPLSVDVTKDADIVCTITNTAVDVTIIKTNDESDGAVEPLETVHYTLSVTVNVGTATNVVVTDTLPDGLTYKADSATPSAGFSVDGQKLTWNVGTLAAGTWKYEYDATVDADASGTLVNHGCVDADQNPALVCSDTEVDVQTIAVTKTNGTTGSVVPGTVVDFTLTLDVANGPIDDATIVDQLPAGIGTVTDISDGGTYDAAGNRITWMLTDVADNEILTYKAKVSASATAGSYTNVATITDGPCQGDGCTDDSTVIVRVPTLVVDKSASTETITISGPNTALVATPSVVTWTLSYTLTSGPVTNAVISDTIPTGFSYVAGSASNGGSFNAGTHTLTWSFPTLSASGSVTFQTTVNPATISRIAPTVNVASIQSDNTAPDQGQDSVTVSVIPPPLAGTPPPLPNTAIGIGPDGTPVNVPIELLAVLFIGSLGALTLANARARSRRR